MKGNTFIWFLGFIGAVVCSSFSNIQSDLIDQTAELGDFINVGRNVTIKSYSAVRSFASVSQNTIIDEHSTIGEYSKIADNCYIGKWVNIQQYSKINSGSEIGSGTNIQKYCSVQKYAKIGKVVTMNKYSSVDNFAQLGDNSILDEYSSIGTAAVVFPNSYVGMYSSVAPNSNVGDSAVILNHVRFPNDLYIRQGGVIMRTPSSFELYRRCDPTFSNKIVETTENTNPNILTKFNNQLEKMIDEQMNTLSMECTQTKELTKPTSLPQIITMYLYEFHGSERFDYNLRRVNQECNGDLSINSNNRNVPINTRFGSNGMSLSLSMSNAKVSINNGQIFINGVRLDQIQSTAEHSMQANGSPTWQLKNELHFGNESRKILEPNVENKFIQLLAIDQDIERNNRVENDTHCVMLEQLRSGQREVQCSNPNSITYTC